MKGSNIMVNSSILNGFKKAEGHNGNNAALRFFVIPKKDRSSKALLRKKDVVEVRTSNNNPKRDTFRKISLKKKVDHSFKAQRSDMSRKVIPENSFARKKGGNARLDLPSPRQSIKSTSHLFFPFSRKFGWGVA